MLQSHEYLLLRRVSFESVLGSRQLDSGWSNLIRKVCRVKLVGAFTFVLRNHLSTAHMLKRHFETAVFAPIEA
jgi:hypothetical protein